MSTLNAHSIEKELDKEYNDLFRNKLKDSITDLKLQTTTCTLNCLKSSANEKNCIESCDSTHNKYFENIEKVFNKRLEVFEKCKDDCKTKKNIESCNVVCIESLKTLFSSSSLYSEIKSISIK